MKKLSLLVKINFLIACLFALLNFPTCFDVSFFAFPIAAVYAVVIGLFTIKKLFLEDKSSVLGLSVRLFQYEPFVFIAAFVIRRAGKYGLPYFVDFVTALVWIAILVLSFIILHYLTSKKLSLINETWAKILSEKKKPEFAGKTMLKRIFVEILEWADALIQAVFTIILLNIFLFQLYEIPSESMVPTFLIKDRVAVFKTFAGPKFPLSDVGLPYIQNYKRGDIVVFRNPHYGSDRESEVKTFMSQFLYMLTLTIVKSNTDENGELKADPLVKRIVGLPGEQLMLMDGKLYARTKDSSFAVVEKEASWSAWDLNGLSGSIRRRIHWIPLSVEEVENTLAVEEERRNLDLVKVKEECIKLSEDFAALCQASSSEYTSFFSNEELFEYNFFSNIFDNSVKLLTSSSGAAWFNHFMNDWYASLGDLSLYSENDDVIGSHFIGGNLYDDACFRLNLMLKLVAGRIIVRNALLIKNGVAQSERRQDEALNKELSKAECLNNYVIHMDQRNMPLFPKDGFIGADSYFMMGDNRYNSLDMRHRYDQKLQKISDLDPTSFYYYCNIEPQAVAKNRILGKASLRFWPLSRAGLMK